MTRQQKQQWRTALIGGLPGFLLGPKGRRVAHALGLAVDADYEKAISGLWARFPRFAGDDALAAIGRDRRIVRGRGEGRASYRRRLRRWLDSWRLAGHAFAVLDQVGGYLNNPDARLRIVTNTGMWYERANDRDVVGRWDADLEVHESGTLGLPAWMRVRCASEGTTTATGPSTVVSGFGAHAARAWSRDGSSWGGLATKGYQNRQPSADLSTWTQSGAPTVTQVVGPDGGIAWEVEDDSVGGEYVVDNNALGPAPAIHTISAWTQLIAISSGPAQIKVREVGVQDFAKLEWTTVDADWTFRSATWNGAAGAGDAEYHVLPARDASSTAILRVSMPQVTADAYPQPYYLGTADPLVWEVDPAVVLRDGYFRIDLTYRPHYANTETAGDHSLVYLNATNRCYFRKSDSKIVLMLDGNTVSLPVTFARHEEIRVEIELTETFWRLKVSSASTGTSSLTPVNNGLIAPLEGIDTIYLLGGPSGCEETADLRSIDTHGTWPRFDWSSAEPNNWDWDGAAASWWRFWVVITCPQTLWQRTRWGESFFGSGTWGSTASLDEVLTVRQLVRTWKAAHSDCEWIVVTFDANKFRADNEPGAPMPDGTWEHWGLAGTDPRPTSRDQDAIYWDGVRAA